MNQNPGARVERGTAPAFDEPEDRVRDGRGEGGFGGLADSGRRSVQGAADRSCVEFSAFRFFIEKADLHQKAYLSTKIPYTPVSR